MKYKLKVYSIWEFGQRKDSLGNPHQEDSMFPEFGKQSDDDRLFILCDGMGGHDAGEVASATVCEAMSRSVLNDGHDKEGAFTVDDFNEALNAAFDALDEKDSGAEKKMGTTMTFLKLHNEGAFIAHMGDSRVYQIRPGKNGEETEIKFQTEDHSLVNDLIKVGELTKDEARYSKQKNIITRAMQPNMGRRPKADIYETVDIKAGDYFYMCSDGMLEQPEMEEGTSLKNIFSEMGGSDEHKVEILKSVTEKNRDNHTAFIIHILEVEDPIEKTTTENTSVASDDKFTAIVEDETADTASSDVDNTETETPVASLPAAKDSQQVGRSKVAFSFGYKKLTSLILCFIGAMIVLVVIILGIKGFRSCSSEKHNQLDEQIQTVPDRKVPKENDNQRRRQVKDEPQQSQPEVSTAVQAANSPASENLTPGKTNTQPQKVTSAATTVAVQNANDEEVVNSDAQNAQENLMNK